MIYIFYHKIDAYNQKYQKYRSQLPGAFQQQILRYRNLQDAQRSLLGKLLLKEGIKFMGLKGYSLSSIKYSAYQRPFFDQSLDFNIAHSGAYVLCAISQTNKLGVDIEEVKARELKDYQDNFSREEWDEIANSNKRLQQFYTLWTQKEAIIKASGEGLSIPLKEVLIRGNTAFVGNEKWHLFPLPFEQDYISYLATDSASSPLSLRQVDFE